MKENLKKRNHPATYNISHKKQHSMIETNNLIIKPHVSNQNAFSINFKYIAEKPKFSVITATYNEVENIKEYIRRVEKALSHINFELIIIDDNSPDKTAIKAKAVGREYGNVRVIVRPRRQGLSSALLYGITLSKAEYVAVMDSDLQHPPEALPKMLETLHKEKLDIVIASRYVDGGQIVGWNPFRKIISKNAIALAHTFIPKTRHIKDPISGFFAFRRSLIAPCIKDINARGFKLLLEILVKCPWSRIKEIPYPFYCRKRGKSKLRLREIYEYICQVTSIAIPQLS